MQFGKHNEKLDRRIAQLELGIEELETLEASASTSLDDDDKPVIPDNAPSERLPKRRREMPAHLAREIRTIEPQSCVCAACGGSLSALRTDVCEYLELEPVRFKVIRQVRPKFACTGWCN